MQQTNSALQQAFEAVKKAKKKLTTQASGVGKKMMNFDIQTFQNELQNFFKNNTDNPVPENRVSKDATPVASLDDGGILYSDGSRKMPGFIPTSPSEQNELNILRQNMLQQIPYTPQAIEEINSASLYSFGKNSQSSADNFAGGYASPGMVSINRNALINNGVEPSWGPASGAEVMSHELLHYLDDNLYKQSFNNSAGNSVGFSQKLKKAVPGSFNKIMNGPLSSKELYDKNNMETRDIESYAFHGMKGPSVFLGDNKTINNSYSRVYQPMSKNLYASPRYPTGETLGRMEDMAYRPKNSYPSQTLEEDY